MWPSLDPVTFAGFTVDGGVFLAGAAAAVVASLMLLRQIMLPRPIPGIPYNKHSARRILGDYPDILRHPNRRAWFIDQAKKHQEPMFQFFVSPFRGPIIFIFDHREAQNLSMRRLKEFDRSKLTADIFRTGVPHGILCMRTSSPEYKSNMSLIRELMTPTFLREVSGPHIYEKVTWLLQLWDKKADISKGRPYDSTNDVHHAALDMIMAASFGIDKSQSMLQLKLDHLGRTNGAVAAAADSDTVASFEEPELLDELAACKVVADQIGAAIKSPVPWLNALVVRNLVPSMVKALGVFDRMARREIGKSVERLHSGHPQRCAMDQLLAREEVLAKKEGRQPDYYREPIKDELFSYIVGGHETTSSALQWGLKYLTTDQRVQSKLRAALYDAFPTAKAEGRLPTMEEIMAPQAHVPYLEACMQEIVRHARPLSIMSRETTVDTTLFGVPVPRGTTVNFTSNGPGYLSPPLDVDEEKRHESARAAKDKTGTPDPTTLGDFLPERWIREAADGSGEEFDAAAAPFLTFGEGPRMCFGKRLAMLEMRIFWVLVLWHFELRPVPKECETEEEAVFLTRIPKHAWVRLERIKYEEA
ncbi:cytochrome P450 monooxygenase [Plectosphaerella plurivora]|uniref:Cytochrome P450 monooxygenase n=1 Tax=Plectosphaerella plurivora TaxID=936078 RepID=A0A9P9ACM2_9PEZI|nr:cytochrome P450 monooxygenase [Plectosphaerella plurivora]